MLKHKDKVLILYSNGYKQSIIAKQLKITKQDVSYLVKRYCRINHILLHTINSWTRANEPEIERSERTLMNRIKKLIN